MLSAILTTRRYHEAPLGWAIARAPTAAMRDAADITLLLRAAASGRRDDLDALLAALYTDMRRLAADHLNAERADHTLQPTALVHEAYIKLLGQRNTDWTDRLHFFAVASRLIRRILVDHARRKGAAKRGGGYAVSGVELADLPAATRGVDLIDLDNALDELAALDEQQAKIVELRFFGGLTLEEVAQELSVGRRSVDRDWAAAKAWLYFRLQDGHAAPADAREPEKSDAG